MQIDGLVGTRASRSSRDSHLPKESSKEEKIGPFKTYPEFWEEYSNLLSAKNTRKADKLLDMFYYKYVRPIRKNLNKHIDLVAPPEHGKINNLQQLGQVVMNSLLYCRAKLTLRT